MNSGKSTAPRLLRRVVPVLVATTSCFVMQAEPANAQLGAPAGPPTTATSNPADLYSRDTPRGLVNGLIGALRAGDYVRASQYFDLSTVPASKRASQGIAIAKKLQTSLDAGGSLIQPVRLSNEASGRIDDLLPVNQERVGTLPAAGGEQDVSLIATSSSRAGRTIWRISSESLAQLAITTPGASGASALRERLPRILRQTYFGGAPVGDWLLLIGAALLYYAVVRVILMVVVVVLTRVRVLKRENWTCRLLENAPVPLSLWISMLLFLATTRTLAAAIVARQFAGRIAGALAFLAFTWLVWRIIDVGSGLVARRMAHSERYRARSILIFTRRALKLLLLMFAAVQALGILGIDVTTGIAALGLGGLAIALGAQKTVENVVGSVSVVVDEPVRVGDFCRVGDVSGTVEEIGIRSTRIRTNDRTRVTIPNGNFAALQIENFSDRDRFLFNPTLHLVRDLDADGVVRVLDALRDGLRQASYLYEGARANFKGFGVWSLDLEIFAWIDVQEATQAIILQEKLLLDVMHRVQSAGGSFAVPVRAVERAHRRT